jgi:hypothetical protein
MVTVSAPAAQKGFSSGLLYAWPGFAVMWAIWACFVIFLCEPPPLAALLGLAYRR